MIIKLNDVHKSFHQGEEKIEVLKGLNWELQKSQSVGLLGRSGSGKSTLLAILAGLDRQDMGEVLICGENLSLMNENELARFRARQMGIVFQQFHLISNLTALENVLLPLEILHIKKAQDKAKEILERVGLKKRFHHFPAQLSGGEKQRVALARAIVNRPTIILADEPSGNLDTQTGEEVMGLLFSLIEEEKKNLVLVTHDEQLAGRCQKRYQLNQGKLSDL